MTDDQWQRLAPLIPTAKPGGRPRTAAIIDSQSVETTEGVLRGYAGGKQVKGRKRGCPLGSALSTRWG